jgi:hypothetical protein
VVMPRRDRWVVTAQKPDDIAFFDENVSQPICEMSKQLYGRSLSDTVYEIFITADEAHNFSIKIEKMGATEIEVRPPPSSRLSWGEESCAQDDD